MLVHPDITLLSSPGSSSRTWLAQGAEAAAMLEQALPPRAFPPWLFNTVAHGLTQPNGHRLWLAALADDQMTLGQWIIWPEVTRRHHWRSPGRAPFGGPQLADDIEKEGLTFLQHTITALRDQADAEELVITLPPPAYGDEITPALLLQLGFQERSRIGSALLQTTPPFLTNLRNAGHRRRLQLAADANLHFAVEPITTLPEWHAALSKWRKERDHLKPPKLSDLQYLAQTCPQEFFIAGVRGPAHEPVACVFAVWNSAQVLYYYLPGSAPAFDDLSPSLTLIRGLYRFCQEAGALWLDLGPSLTSDGQPNAGLAEFKRRLGAETQFRRVLEMRL